MKVWNISITLLVLFLSNFQNARAVLLTFIQILFVNLTVNVRLLWYCHRNPVYVLILLLKYPTFKIHFKHNFNFSWNNDFIHILKNDAVNSVQRSGRYPANSSSIVTVSTTHWSVRNNPEVTLLYPLVRH